jgi:hypothetical protein
MIGTHANSDEREIENGPPHAKDLRAAGRRSIIHLTARLRKRCIPLD